MIKDLEDRLHQQNLANESAQSNAGASEGAKAEVSQEVLDLDLGLAFQISPHLYLSSIVPLPAWTLFEAPRSSKSNRDVIIQTTPSPEERSYIQNLERENKLMASAYYDLASRLQMNNVILQRRAEVPKSWLGRQRKAMEAVGGLVR